MTTMMGNQRQSSQEQRSPLAPVFSPAAVTPDLQPAPCPLPPQQQQQQQQPPHPSSGGSPLHPHSPLLPHPHSPHHRHSPHHSPSRYHHQQHQQQHQQQHHHQSQYHQHQQHQQHQQQQHQSIVGGPSGLLHPSGTVGTHPHHPHQLSPHHQPHPQHPHPHQIPQQPHPQHSPGMLEHAPHPQFSKWQQLPPRPPPSQAPPGGFAPGPGGGQAQHGYMFPEGVPPTHHPQFQSGREMSASADLSHSRHPSGTLSAEHSPHRQPGMVLSPQGSSPHSPHRHAEFHHQLREGGGGGVVEHQRMQVFVESMETQHQHQQAGYPPAQRGVGTPHSVPSGGHPHRPHPAGGVNMDFAESDLSSQHQQQQQQQQQQRFPHGQPPTPHHRPPASDQGDVHMGYESPAIHSQTDCAPPSYKTPRPTSDPPVFHIQLEGEGGETGHSIRSVVPVIQGGEMEEEEEGQEGHWGAGGEGRDAGEGVEEGGEEGDVTMGGPGEARPRLWCAGGDGKEDEAISDSEPSIGADDYEEDDSSPELSPRLPKAVCRLRLTRSTHQGAGGDMDPDCWGVQEGTSGGKRGTGDFDPGEDFDEPLDVSEGERSPSGLHHSKFKKRLHDRYVSSLGGQSGSPFRGRGNSEERAGGGGGEEEGRRRGERRRGARGCRSEGDNVGHPLPAEAAEARSCDTPDNDVFMEASPSAATQSSDPAGSGSGGGGRSSRSKPLALGESEPLDLSRATLPPPPAGLSPHSPGLSPDLATASSSSSPGGSGTKPFSPVNFRSPHRLPYPSHGLLSPQSPLCSVPEGGRIFNFNVPSPFEGPHSDSDLLSPSPMSPRIFQFPPHGTMLNTMSEVNRLAVSPRALYPSGSLHPSAQGSRGFSGGPLPKESTKAYYEKRSLSESDVTYLCPICGQVFPAYDNLAKHMAKHLPTETVRAGDNNKIHYCKVCNRSFSRSDMLTRHMRLHTGLKPYECADCGQVFSRSDHLNTHRRTHTGEKPYRCPHCPYAACRRDMITRHMRTHAKRSAKRGRFLSVPEPEPSEVRKSSVSSTETTDSQEQSVRTCSVSSVESGDSESHHRTSSSSADPAGGSTTGEDPPPPQSDGPWITPKQERVDPAEEDRKPVFGSGGGGGGGGGGGSGLQGYDPFSGYRKPRNWSVTSVDSVTSEDLPHSRHDSVADDTFLEPGDRGEAEDSPLLDPDTLKRCTISGDPFPR